MTGMFRRRLRNLRRRVFAFAMHHAGDTYEPLLAIWKQQLLANITGKVLEIGFGTGTNLQYLARGTRWAGVDISPYMIRYARTAIDQTAGIQMPIVGDAVRLPFGDESFDAVICTHVLCSVSRPDDVVKEILRVLRSGGRFAFLEHVAAPAGSSLRRTQRRIRPLWRVIGDGCEPDRTTGLTIKSAGFARVDYRRIAIDLPIVRPHIAGSAWKAEPPHRG